MNAIKKKLRTWLLEPKSSADAGEYLALLILVGLILTLFTRAMIVVFAEGFLVGIQTIFAMLLGVVIMTITIFMTLYVISFIIRIAVNLAINTYNHFKKGDD